MNQLLLTLPRRTFGFAALLIFASLNQGISQSIDTTSYYSITSIGMPGKSLARTGEGENARVVVQPASARAQKQQWR